MKKQNKKQQGKRNRINGANFEKRVRRDLESKGWIVSKWQNNVEFLDHYEDEGFKIPFGDKFSKCVPAKPGRFRMMQTGFPDFIAYKYPSLDEYTKNNISTETGWFKIVFIEVKTNGYLSKDEKEKAKWYLKNNYCSKFLIAKKVKKGRKIKIEYKDFEEYDK